MCVADKFKCQIVHSLYLKLLESIENYSLKILPHIQSEYFMHRMKNLRFLCSNRIFWLCQERKLLSTTKYKCLHVWQMRISMATLEVFSDTGQTKHYRRVNSVHWNSGAAATISSINFDRFSYSLDSEVFIEFVRMNSLCDSFPLNCLPALWFSERRIMRFGLASIAGGFSAVAIIFGAVEAVNRLTAACKNYIASRPIHEVAFVMSDALPCCRHTESRETVRNCKNPHCKAKLSHKIIEHIDKAKHLICLAM